MKTELVTLVAAILAATASISGVVLNQRGILELERSKWEQAREDEIHRVARTAVADFARELSGSVQRAALLVWRAKFDPESVTRQDFLTYDAEASAGLSRILSGHIILAAHNRELYETLKAAVNTYYWVDAELIKAGARFRQNRAEGLKAVAALHDTVESLELQLSESFIAAMAILGNSRGN